MQEFAEIPGEFLKEGTQFLNRCQKRTLFLITASGAYDPASLLMHRDPLRLTYITANKKEFIKLCQAVGMGFVVMGAIGYIIRVIHIPVNQILVS
jgi:protein transport protein SEC61 subunit gamma-like protein